jgi:hypothetical protein
MTGMERKMTNPTSTTTLTDRRPPAERLALPAAHPEPIELQRWEDDGGAVLSDVAFAHACDRVGCRRKAA